MKHTTRDPSPAEQEAAFAAEYEQRNAGLNGRHTEKAPRKRYARRPGPPKYFRGLLPGSGRACLLEAASQLSGPFGKPFGLSALVLTAWRHFPELFGLPGAEKEHPSDNKVRCLLFGSKGLIARRLIEKCEGGLMRVAGGKEC